MISNNKKKKKNLFARSKINKNKDKQINQTNTKYESKYNDIKKKKKTGDDLIIKYIE